MASFVSLLLMCLGLIPSELVLGSPTMGCHFNHDYEVSSDQKKDSILIDPVWGGDIETLNIQSEEELAELMEKMEEINQNLLLQHQFNTMDIFFEFYDAYKNYLNVESDGKFGAFFQQYTQKYRPFSDAASFTVELVKEMAKTLPDLAAKTYLSTCSLFYNKETLEHIEQEASVLPNDYFHNHVAGFIKFTLGNNTGYIFLDPGMGLVSTPIVSESKFTIDDLKACSVSQGLTRAPKGLSYRYKLKNSFILGEEIIPIVPMNSSPKKEKQPLRQICYVGKPYCSFLQTTSKPALTNPDRSVMKFRKGHLFQAKAVLAMDVFDNSDKSGVAAWIRRDDGWFGKVENFIFAFSNSSQIRQAFFADDRQMPLLESIQHDKKSNHRQVMRDVCSELGINMNETLKKIGNILDDFHFTEQLKNMYQWFANGPHSAEYDMQDNLRSIKTAPKYYVNGQIITTTSSTEW